MEISKTKREAQEYPEPYIVPPRSETHLQSFIILHGRGDEGQIFGAHLLMTQIPEFTSLQDAFPHGKFIFPTASKRRANVFARMQIHQWFDNWSLQDPTKNAELQYDGLRDSSRFVHQLLKKEIDAVGAENVILWGLSQGMAMSMISLMLWEGPRFAAAVGMCGWIPLKAQVEMAVQDENDNLENKDDLFEVAQASMSGVGGATVESSNPAQRSKLEKAATYLREELELQNGEVPSTLIETPIYVGHGMEDEKLPTVQGQEAQELLQILGFEVESRLYDGLGHWYSPDMLNDIIQFLQRKTGIRPNSSSQCEER